MKRLLKIMCIIFLVFSCSQDDQEIDTAQSKGYLKLGLEKVDLQTALWDLTINDMNGNEIYKLSNNVNDLSKTIELNSGNYVLTVFNKNKERKSEQKTSEKTSLSEAFSIKENAENNLLDFICRLLKRLGIERDFCNEISVPSSFALNFGGSGRDVAESIIETSDGGYAIAGWTNSTDGDVTNPKGNIDYWIVKIDASGIIEWEKSFGGSRDDRALSISQTTNGGFIVGGVSNSFDGDILNPKGSTDIWIINLTKDGDLSFSQSIGGSGKDELSVIRQLPKEQGHYGYIVAGSSDSTDGDITNPVFFHNKWVVKLTPSLAIEWDKSFSASSIPYPYIDDIATDIRIVDTGYIVTGAFDNEDVRTCRVRDVCSDAWVAKLDWLGNTEWESFLGNPFIWDYPVSILPIDNGDYILGGESQPEQTGPFSESKYWLAKLDNTGNIEWQNYYGGSSSDFLSSMEKTLNGGYILAGGAFSKDGNITNPKGSLDYWILKTNSSGEIEWQKSLGGSNTDFARSVQQTSDGGYIIAGSSESLNGDINNPKGGSDFWIVKLDSEGNL